MSRKPEAVRLSQGFEQNFQGGGFDFIFIDAPLGGDMTQYARLDVLSLIPNCLAGQFVIMLDDCDHVGEKRTFAEMQAQLTLFERPFATGVYHGEKEFRLLVDPQWKYLCSM